ncbi:MAG: lipopolysaccharide biosynthesis protein [Sedimentisphaerales bacterium]|nr:lipopolysaccharide biosynthesis protein [Sedimentisphaerales bacterium]
MSNRKSRAINGTLTSFIQFSVRIILQAALSPLVLRVAGQETLGAYSILMQVIAYLALVDLGFGVALSRYLAQAHGHDDNGRQFREVFETGRTHFLFSNAIFALLAFILSYHIGSIFSFSHTIEAQAKIGLWILASWSIIRVPFAVYGGALTATQNMAAANIINMIGNSLRLILSLCTVIAGMGLIGLMISNVIAEAVTYIIHRWYYQRIYPDENFSWGIPNWRLFGEMMKFGLGYLFVIIGGRLAFQSDNLVVGMLYGGTKTSIYYTTQMPAFILIAFIWMIADNAGPAINELYARKNVARLTNNYMRLLKYSMLLGLALASGLLIFNRNMVTLWVGSIQYAGDLMTVSLSVFAIATIINHVHAIIMVANGAVRYLSIISIIGGIANLILSFLLGTLLGLEGVMVASAVIEVIVMIMFWIYCMRLMNISFIYIWRNSIMPAITANCFIIPIVIYAIKENIPANLPSFIIWFSIFIFITLTSIALVGLDKADFQDIHIYLGNVFSRLRRTAT